MNKLLSILFGVMLIVGSAGTAMACIGIGCLDIDADAFEAVGEKNHKHIPNGVAGGMSGAIGSGEAEAAGCVFNGTVEGEVGATGGALTNTDSYRMHNPVPDADKSIGVGSASFSQGNTAANAKIKVDPSWGFGGAEASIHGFAAQGTLNGSMLTESPRYFDTTGFTGGIAGQGSIGGFHGSAHVMAGPDYIDWEYGYYGGEPGGRGWYIKDKNPQSPQFGRIQYFRNGHPENNSEWSFLGKHRGWHPVIGDTKAGAGMGAEINMYGNSYSESYRAVAWGDGYKTELMGTNVGAYTTVESSGYAYDWDKGLSCAHADVSGGWMAAGGAASYTTQTAGGLGGATATAVGFYAGSGGLNSNYNGSAVGGTHTTVTTFDGLKGSINTSGASMSVTSNVTHGGPGPQ